MACRFADTQVVNSTIVPTTLVLGIGNLLLTDEGVGIHVVNYLVHHYPTLPGVSYLDGGTLSFLLAARIADAERLIVVDAAELGALPATVRTFSDVEMDRFLRGTRRSAHEVGLVDVLNMARLAGRFPSRRALVCIQPAALGWGDRPSPMVAAAVPSAAREVIRLLEMWTVTAEKSH